MTLRRASILAFLVLLSAAIASGPAQAQKPKTADQAASSQTPPAKVDLNAATEKELEGLPGVGAATAKKIIAGRPYASVGDLAKAGVPAATITKITPMVTIGAVKPPVTPPPAVPPAKTPSAAAPPAAKAPAAATAAVETPAQVPPVKGMVWVNLETKVYHMAGDRWYGKTKSGKFMTEADAIKAGYRAAKEGGTPKK